MDSRLKKLEKTKSIIKDEELKKVIQSKIDKLKSKEKIVK